MQAVRIVEKVTMWLFKPTEVVNHGERDAIPKT